MIRALIVDDSSFMRKCLTHILESDGSIVVVGTATDGKDAVHKAKQLRPDVVLLDIEMPVMDGLVALAHIMSECPTRVLMLSALNKTEATIAIKSLEHGAVDFIAKPSGVISYDIEKLSSEIIAKVKVAADVNVHKLDLCLPKEMHRREWPKSVERKKLVVIGASTGGPRAVALVLSALPRDILAAIIVIQHMSPGFVPTFVDRLQWGCSPEISLAQEGEVIKPGRVLVVPGGCHTSILQNGVARKIHLSTTSSPHAIFPSVDHAMESAARAYGEDTLGVLLTGTGSDGARGMKALKDAGGSTIAEDQSTCVAFGMPKAAIDMGCVDEIVPLQQIANTILKMI
ncbi:chemotaxis response regulator protein-glutamate methylesterase [Acidobacteriia bacterium AH_259_A11_L15]|nr:chemotaxis response regulator protein-glutamate methylesterase [Acidobacteriia bacterium AH_259_A11_L15]